MSSKKKIVKLHEDEYGEFVLRITNKRCDIESTSKLWKVTFMDGTSQYQSILSLVAANTEDTKNTLKTLFNFYFAAAMMFIDADVAKGVIEVIKKKLENIKEVPPVNDDEILAEDRLINEKDTESFDKYKKEVKKNESEGSDS